MRRLVVWISLLLLALAAAPAAGRAPQARGLLDYDLTRVRAAMRRAAERVGPPPADAAAAFRTVPFSMAHRPEPITLSQPDGTTFRATAIELLDGGGQATLDGHLITRGEDGWWYYGRRQPDGRIAATDAVVGRDTPPDGTAVTDAPPAFTAALAGLRQHHETLRRWMAARTAAMAAEARAADEPVVFKIPALMFAVNGTPFQPSSTPEVFEAQLDGIGTSPTGTLTEMYLEQSFGNMIIEVDVYGPYTSVLSQPPNDCWYGTEGGPILGEFLGLGGLGSRGMAEEAVPMSDPDVDYSQYDNDGDGWVDFLLIIHSGPGAEATGDPCDVWSHYFGPIAGEPTTVTSDGVVIGPVMTVPEIDSAIGVTAHELMHALGEPDYYGTAGTQGTGDWDLGAGGSWLGIPAQTNPIHFNPVMKINFGWVEPTIITDTTFDVTVRPRARYPDLVMIPLKIAKAGTDAAALCDKAPVDKPGQNNNFYLPNGDCLVEGFLIENLSRVAALTDRESCTFDPADFDRQAYGSGLAIWHWDFTNYQQLGNNNVLRPMLDLEEFDRRDAVQDMARGTTRAEPLDLFWGDPVGISGATGLAPEGLDIPSPEGSPWTVTGAPGAGAEGTEAQPIPEWEAVDAPEGTGMTVTLSWDVPTDDWDLYVDEFVDGEWVEVASSAGGAPQTSEQVTIFDFGAGRRFRARAYNWLGPTSPQATVTVSYDTSGLTQLGPAHTRNNDLEQTGWQITNIRPADYRGVAHADELPEAVITFDVIKHDDTTVDVSPDFLTVAEDSPTPLVAGRTVTLETRVYNHGGAPVSGATFSLYDADPSSGAAPLATVTRDLGAFDRQTVTFSYTLQPGLNELYVRSSAPGDVVAGNDVVRTELVASPFADAEVLIVDNDRGWTQEESYEAVLAALGVPYHVVVGEPDADTLADYDAVIWLTTTVSGAEGVISKAAVAAITEYLDGGGRLWLASTRAAGYLGSADLLDEADFLARYFGVVADNNILNSPGTLRGLGAPIGGERQVAIGYLDGRPYLDYGHVVGPDDDPLEVRGTATGVFEHPARPGEVVMTMVDGEPAEEGGPAFRTVWGVPLTLVSDGGAQLELMGEVLDFFGVPTGVAQPPIPQVRHYRFQHVQVGEPWPVVVGATAPDGISSVELRYRPYGDSQWRTLTLAPVVDGLYQGTIPAADVGNSGLEYYVTATTGGGTVIETAGGAELPNVASAPYGDPVGFEFGVCAAGQAPPPPAPEPPAPAPLPTTGGGMALAALAVAAAAVLRRRVSG